MFANNEPWMADGICRQVDIDLWFPEKGDGRGFRTAKAICGGCPVMRECLDYAVTNFIRVGVWGGTSEGDRRKLWKGAA